MPGGPFRWSLTSSPKPYHSLEVYVEVKAAGSDQANELSSRYHVWPQLGYAGCLQCGLLGTVKRNRIRLKLLSGWPANDTAEAPVGELRPDTIVGMYRGFWGVIKFVKER